MVLVAFFFSQVVSVYYSIDYMSCTTIPYPSSVVQSFGKDIFVVKREIGSARELRSFKVVITQKSDLMELWPPHMSDELYNLSEMIIILV